MISIRSFLVSPALLEDSGFEIDEVVGETNDTQIMDIPSPGRYQESPVNRQRNRSG